MFDRRILSCVCSVFSFFSFLTAIAIGFAKIIVGPESRCQSDFSAGFFMLICFSAALSLLSISIKERP